MSLTLADQTAIIEDARHPNKYRMLLSMVDVMFVLPRSISFACAPFLTSRFFLVLSSVPFSPSLLLPFSRRPSRRIFDTPDTRSTTSPFRASPLTRLLPLALRPLFTSFHITTFSRPFSFADVAQPDQARIVALNAHHFLKNNGHVVVSIKANCIDSTAPAEVVFASEVKKMQEEMLKPHEQLTLGWSLPPILLPRMRLLTLVRVALQNPTSATTAL
jgi:hypothetical protein